MAFFMIFSFLKKNLDIKKIIEFEFLNPIVGCYQVHSGVAVLPFNVTAQIFFVSEMWRYVFGVANIPSKFECSNPFPRCGVFFMKEKRLIHETSSSSRLQ